MNENEFKDLCRQIADVPWKFGPTVHTGTTTHRKAQYANHRVEHHTNGNDHIVDLLTDDWRDHLRFMFAERPSPQQLATARSFFANLELEYITHEIAPNAPWRFGENHAQTNGMMIIRRMGIADRWTMGIGPSWLRAESVEGLISAYREDRAQHEAARGVKTRQRKPQPKPQTEWRAPLADQITVEHARNIVACMANPNKYTRIAQWARICPALRASILRRALEAK